MTNDTYSHPPPAPVDLLLGVGRVSPQNHVQRAVARQHGRRYPLHPGHAGAKVLKGFRIARGQAGALFGELAPPSGAINRTHRHERTHSMQCCDRDRRDER